MTRHPRGHAALRLVLFLAAVLFAPFVSSADVTPAANDSDVIFNYAEAAYPQFLSPAGAVSRTAGIYYYRYYPGTNAYIATANGRFYYLGPASNNQILDLGTSSDWLATSMGLWAGSVNFSGPYPTIADATFTTKSGQSITMPGYPGLVELHVDSATPASTVTAAIQSNGGNMVGMIPRVGIYTVKVSLGAEASFLSSIYRNTWVEEGFVAFPSLQGRAITIDANTPGTSACDALHGSSVFAIQSRRTSDAVFLDLSTTGRMVAVSGLGWGTTLQSWDMVRLAYTNYGTAAQSGVPIVVNLSWQAPAAQGSASLNWNFCTSPACNAARYQELAYLAGAFKVVEENLKIPGSPAHRMIFTMITGNFGVELDSQIAVLKNHYPEAFKRVVLVGGSNESGQVYGGENHLINNSLNADGVNDVVYTRGVNVAVNATDKCSGTSFAAPEVASVLDYIWSRNPGLSADQVVTAFKRALAELGTNGVVPQDTNGFTTQNFLDRAVTLAGGTPPIPTPPPPPPPPPGGNIFRGTGQGNGSVTIPSSPGCTASPNAQLTTVNTPSVELQITSGSLTANGPFSGILIFGPSSITVVNPTITCIVPNLPPVIIPGATQISNAPASYGNISGSSDGHVITIPDPATGTVLTGTVSVIGPTVQASLNVPSPALPAGVSLTYTISLTQQ